MDTFFPLSLDKCLMPFLRPSSSSSSSSSRSCFSDCLCCETRLINTRPLLRVGPQGAHNEQLLQVPSSPTRPCINQSPFRLFHSPCFSFFHRVSFTMPTEWRSKRVAGRTMSKSPAMTKNSPAKPYLPQIPDGGREGGGYPRVLPDKQKSIRPAHALIMGVCGMDRRLQIGERWDPEDT